MTLSNCGLNSKYTADLGAALAFNTTIAKLNLRNNPLGAQGVADIVNGLRKQIDTVRRMLVPSPRVALNDSLDPDSGVGLSKSHNGSQPTSRPSTVNRMGGAQHIKRRTTAELGSARSKVAAERAELEFHGPLKSLNLTNTDITDAQNARDNMLQPQMKSVVGNRSGTKALAGYLLNPHCGLTRLNLSKNEIDDHCMAPLIRALGHNSSLVSLSFKQSNLGPTAAHAVATVAMRTLPPDIPDAIQFEDDFAALGVPSPFAVFRPVPPATYHKPRHSVPTEIGLETGPDTEERVWTASGLPSRQNTPGVMRVREAPIELAMIAPWSAEFDARPQTQASLASYMSTRTHGTYSTWNFSHPLRTHDGLSPTNLMKLNLRSCRIGDDGAATIGTLLRQRSNLRELILTQNDISPVGIRQICRGLRVGSLVSLVISQNPLHVEGGFMLAETLQGGSCQLRELHAGHCMLTDNGTDPRGAIAIAESLSLNTKLRLLALPGNCLTSQKMSFLRTREAVVQAFGKSLEQNITLELLDVSENWVGAAGQQALQGGIERAPRVTRHADVITEVLSEWIRLSFKRRNGTMADFVAREDAIAASQGRELLDTFGNPYALTRALAESKAEAVNDGSVSGRAAYDIQIIKNNLQSRSANQSEGATAAQYAAVLTRADTQRVVLGDGGQPMTLLATDSTFEVTEAGYAVVHKADTQPKSDKQLLRSGLLSPHLPPYRPPSQMRDGREVVSADWRPARHLAKQMARNKQWRDLAASTPGVGQLSAAEAAQLRMTLPVPATAPSLASAGIVRAGTLHGLQVGVHPSALSRPPTHLDAPNSMASITSLGSAGSSDMSVGEMAVMLGSASKGCGLPDALETAMHGMQLKAGYGKRPPTNRKYYEQWRYGAEFRDTPSRGNSLSQAEIARRANVRDGGASAASDLSSLFSSGFGNAPVSLQEALKIATAGGAYDDQEHLMLKQAKHEAALMKATSGTASSPHRVRTVAAKSPVPRLNLLPLKAQQRAHAMTQGSFPRVEEREPLATGRSSWSAGDISSDELSARQAPQATQVHHVPLGYPEPPQESLAAAAAAAAPRLSTAVMESHNAQERVHSTHRAQLNTAALRDHDEATLYSAPLGTEAPWYSQALQGSMPGTAASGQRPAVLIRAGSTAVNADTAQPAGFSSTPHHANVVPKARQGMAARLGGSLVRAEWDSRPPLHPPSSFKWVKPRVVKQVLDYLGVERSVRF